MDFKLTPETIRQIFRMSEGAVSPIRGRVRGVVVDRIAHAGERHTAITREDLYKREAGNNQIDLFTAFIDFKQALEAATLLLNLDDVTPELERLYYAEEGRRGVGECALTRDVQRLFQVRYKGGSGTLPTSIFTMVLHKKVGFPCNLMIYTFFPTLEW